MADPPLSRTPIPIPLHFHRAEAPFSCRRRGPARPCSLTPRPPVKSAGPVSRIFPRGGGAGAGGGGGGGPERAWTRTLSVSPGTAGPLPPRSGVYDQSKGEPFFEQCFEKIGRLGRGSFGEVFKVRSRDDGRLYAVKRSVDRYRGEGDRARRLRESRCRATLGAHRNLLPLWGSWEEGGRLYLQTELCGGTLQQAAEGRGGPLEEGRVWGALADVLGGLKHLHDRHMAHMDVKPANIFIGPQGEHKLGDFGLLLPLRGPKRGEEQEGDPRYMAPELLDGVYTTAADVFSLGISILEICSDLDIPRSGEGWQKLRQGYLPTEFLKGLSPELLEVLRAMLNPDHRQRVSVDELLAVPAVKRAQRWRRGQLLLRWWLGWALAVWQYLLSALGHLWRGGFLPLFRLFLPRAPAPPSSPPPSALNDSSLYSDWWEASLGEDVFEPLADPPLTRAGNHRVDSTGPGSTADSITARSLGHTSTPRNLALDEDSGNRSPNLSFIGRDSPTLTPPPRGSLLPPSPAGDPLPPGRATFEPRNLLSLFDESVECN